MKTVKVTMSSEVENALKDFHGLSNESVEDLVLETYLEEGLGVNLSKSGIELKVYYIYETDEGRWNRLSLDVNQTVIIASSEEDLLLKINEYINSELDKKSGRPYENQLIITEVSPENLIEFRSLPSKCKFAYIDDWEMLELDWKES